MEFPSIDPADVGTTGLLWLFLSYGYILYWASNLISEGSDLLMAVPSMAGLVGGVVLPILGAVPDGAIMLFSGLGDIERAQETLSVGIGSLAGSTIMLMTIPFAAAVFTGRVDLDPQTQMMPNYMNQPKLTPNLGIWNTLTKTGIAITRDVQIGGIILMVTSIPFFMIQVPGMFIRGPLEEVTPQIAEAEKYWALSGLIVCVIFFVWYLRYQIQINGEGVARMKRIEATKKQLLLGKVSLSGALYDVVKSGQEEEEQTQRSQTTSYQSISTQDSIVPKSIRSYLEDILLEPFHIYDTNHNGHLEKKEFKFFMRDFHEAIEDDDVDQIYKDLDQDSNGVISFQEFIDACYQLIIVHGNSERKSTSRLPTKQLLSDKHQAMLADGMFGLKKDDGEDGDDDDDEENEVEDLPEDIAQLSPEEQQSELKKRALIMLTIGTSLAVLFSDPLVGVFAEMATRLNISPFYVAFVLAPIGSNASEFIASQYYAAKKTRKSITVSLTALEGAGNMSNTFCLSIFMGLIYFRGLAWSYTAETIAILLVEYALAGMVQKSKLTTLQGLIILSFYPLSLVFVATMEHFGID